MNRVERPLGLESRGGPLGDPGEAEPSGQDAPGAADSPQGCFVVLEGIDGCGKTTQLEHLGRWLPSSGLIPAGARLLMSREPGGTPLGRALRDLLLHPPAGASPCSDAELLLYAADRAQHVAQVIRPALEAGDWVLCDRFSGSTAAYQGYGRGLPLERIAALEGFAPGGLEPDLTIWTCPWRNRCGGGAAGPPTGSRPRATPSWHGWRRDSPPWPASGAGSGSMLTSAARW